MVNSKITPSSFTHLTFLVQRKRSGAGLTFRYGSIAFKFCLSAILGVIDYHLCRKKHKPGGNVPEKDSCIGMI